MQAPFRKWKDAAALKIRRRKTTPCEELGAFRRVNLSFSSPEFRNRLGFTGSSYIFMDSRDFTTRFARGTSEGFRGQGIVNG
jgi:hypothetical protein